MARVFHVCFMYLNKMTAFIASNAVLLSISYVKWTIFKSKKRSAFLLQVNQTLQYKKRQSMGSCSSFYFSVVTKKLSSLQ